MTRDEQRASNEYRRFVCSLSAARARNNATPDPNSAPAVAALVGREQMLDAFFRRHPRFAQFRGQLGQKFSFYRRGFPVSRERWAALSA